MAIEFIDAANAKLFYIKGNKLLGREIINLSENDDQALKEHLGHSGYKRSHL